MPRYIDADEFMSKFVNEFWSADISFSSVDDIVEKLVKKAEDVAPVVHAHWVKHEYAEEFYDRIIPNYECSHCHEWFRDDRDYCGECGARMDEEVISEEV